MSVKFYMLAKYFVPFPWSLFTAECITNVFPNPKSMVERDSVSMCLVKQSVSTEKHRPSWALSKQKFVGKNF